MFLSKNRKKSARKAAKADCANLSIKICKHNITNSPVIAGSTAAISNCDQRSRQNQNKSDLNSVKQYSKPRTISSDVIESNASNIVSESNGEASSVANRRTYSLEKVSKSLDEVMASGRAILDALSAVKGTPIKGSDGNQLISNALTTNGRTDVTKRGTYDLDKVSHFLDTSVNSGGVLETHLQDISLDSSKENACNSSSKRYTYDLDTVSSTLDHTSAQNSSINEVLLSLGLDGSQDDSNSRKRDTYDLEKVETSLECSLDADRSMQNAQSLCSPEKIQNRRGTYDQSNVSNQLDQSLDASTLSESSSSRQAVKRDTYNLSDVSDLLDGSVTSGKSIDESLDQMSSIKDKRRTYDLSESNLISAEQLTIDNNNTITADKQSSSRDLSKSVKRNTYVLDDSDESSQQVDLGKCSENYKQDDAKPVDGVLAELGLDREDGKKETDLTPKQWMEHMNGLETSQSPPLKPTILLPLKLTLGPKKADTNKDNGKSVKKMFSLTTKKQSSQTISGASSGLALNCHTESEMRSKSMSDSKVKGQLKSRSSPNITTSTLNTDKVPRSGSLEEISPGIRNYLANKLGLSVEQCIAVHRRLNSESVPDASKLENRKTYSLDDVAHSLDIATSQGLPMTEVLDNLDAKPTNSDSNSDEGLNNSAKQKSDANSNNLETEKPVVGDIGIANNKPQALNLETETAESIFPTNRNTYIKTNASSCVASPTTKTPTIEKQFKLVRKKAVYKPSAKLQSFSHLLGAGGGGGQVPLRMAKRRMDALKRNTYTLESVAESLEKAQDAGIPMLDALKRLSGSCQSAPSEELAEKRRTYNLEDLSNTLETAAAGGEPIVDTLRKIADPSSMPDQDDDEVFDTQSEVSETPEPQPKKIPPPKPKRTFSNSSKAEIKFVSDSFVIEYYTSPPRKSQSNSGVPTEKSSTQEKYDVKSNEAVKIKPNLYVNHTIVQDAIEGKSISPSNQSQSLKGETVKERNPPSPKSRKFESQKPTTEVVSDLDCLLLKLAAEVEKPTHSVPSTPGTKIEPNAGVVFNTKTDLAKTRSDHSSTKLDISSTQTDFVDTNSVHLSTKLENQNTKHEISSTKTDPSDTKADNLSTKTDFSDGEMKKSSTKSDDEGYCSLSRKPGTRLLGMDDEIQLSSEDLFKKEKLATGSEKDHGIAEENSKVEIIRTFDSDGRESQEGVIELTVENDTQENDTQEKDPDSDSNDSPKADTVSRELNLLRLRLAEKQRDIEAQKQRTKEQQDEERKRLGQNVFWLAVGKGRERKEDRQTKWTEKDTQQSYFGRHVISNQSGKPLNLEPSNNNKFTTFRKQLSLEGDLPPSMGKLQDRTFNLVHTKSISEEKMGPSSSLYQRLDQDRTASSDVRNPTQIDHKTSLEDRSSTEGVVRFRLSQQAPGFQDAVLNNEQSPGNNFSETSESQTSEKSKTPVMNYKSRINVPVSFQNKPNSEKCLGSGNFQNSENAEDRSGGENRDFQELNSKGKVMPAMSPQRKVWDTETASNHEPSIAVSASNYHIFDQNNSGAVEKSQAQETSVVLNDEMNKNDQIVEIGATNYNPSDSDSPGHSEGERYSEIVGDKGSPNEEGEDVSVQEDPDTPKKGLALFIGQENTATNSDGLTPEQLRKREKFLRNRQQKIEEEKMKKEALLEKKRRKDEKLKEIQVRRELEEQGRQARLQEKREQAEHARHERQKYELKKKENFPRANFGDGTSGGNSGNSRTTANAQGIDVVPGGNVGYNRILMGTQGVDGIAGGNARYARSPVKTPVSGGNVFEGQGPGQSNTPSAFSGFTGVQSYVKPSGKTNRKLIINAVTHVCLPGVVNKETKEKCLQAMTESSAQHFLILFKEGLKFRALYSLDMENTQVLKVYGIGPRSVTEKMIEQLYKYNSGGKEFSKIPAKGFSLSVDGFTLQKSCWQSNKPAVPSKTASNFKHSRPTR